MVNYQMVNIRIMKKMYIKPVCVSNEWQMSGNVLANVSSGGNGPINGTKENTTIGGDVTRAPGRIVWI